MTIEEKVLEFGKRLASIEKDFICACGTPKIFLCPKGDVVKAIKKETIKECREKAIRSIQEMEKYATRIEEKSIFVQIKQKLKEDLK